MPEVQPGPATAPGVRYGIRRVHGRTAAPQVKALFSQHYFKTPTKGYPLF